ncbi:hypothetical protein DMC63_38005 [Streptomyces sp. WAC 05977]|nr:hypothetical protein DMC63_38005 [Streptomyces sp. WAC 05977]
MSLNWFIPTTIIHLGAILLLLGIVLVFLDVPGKGVPWDKVGAGFAIVGGFGVGGGAAGWLGRTLFSTSGSMLTATQQLTTQAVGVGVVGVVLVGLCLWAYSRVRGKGIAAKTKFKSLIVVFVLAIAGTTLSLVPKLHDWANDATGWAGNAVITAIR